MKKCIRTWLEAISIGIDNFVKSSQKPTSVIRSRVRCRIDSSRNHVYLTGYSVLDPGACPGLDPGFAGVTTS